MSGPDKVSDIKSYFHQVLEELDPGLKEHALTHVSWANENKEPQASNERLEFLGDAVLSLACASYLYSKHPDASEGELTRMRANLVSGQALAACANALDVGTLMKLGRGEEITGGRQRQRSLASALEALFGAVYLSLGWEKARDLAVKVIFGLMQEESTPDPKTLLQEFVQRTPGLNLEYLVIAVTGPEHAPNYTVGAVVNGKIVSRGSGASKKEAEEAAAREALRLLTKERQ